MIAGGPVRNWYEMLGLDPSATNEEIAAATERLARQAASLATTSPERSQQLRDTVRTIRADLLTGQDARARYDARVSVDAPSKTSLPGSEHLTDSTTHLHPRSPQPGYPDRPIPSSRVTRPATGGGIIDSVVNGIAPAASRLRRFLQSGWTCPSCGADGAPADKFCSKCGEAMERAPAAPRCTGCDRPLSAGGRFCPHCGTATS
jgi:hypothetical protein